MLPRGGEVLESAGFKNSRVVWAGVPTESMGAALTEVMLHSRTWNWIRRESALESSSPKATSNTTSAQMVRLTTFLFTTDSSKISGPNFVIYGSSSSSTSTMLLGSHRSKV